MKIWWFKLNGMWFIISDFQYIFLTQKSSRVSKINTTENFMEVSHEAFALKFVDMN